MLGLDEATTVNVNQQTIDWTAMKEPLEFEDPVQRVLRETDQARIAATLLDLETANLLKNCVPPCGLKELSKEELDRAAEEFNK
jgi:hypothetical protein